MQNESNVLEQKIENQTTIASPRSAEVCWPSYICWEDFIYHECVTSVVLHTLGQPPSESFTVNFPNNIKVVGGYDDIQREVVYAVKNLDSNASGDVVGEDVDEFCNKNGTPTPSLRVFSNVYRVVRVNGFSPSCTYPNSPCNCAGSVTPGVTWSCGS